MNLPPKALTVLISIRAELLSKDSVAEEVVVPIAPIKYRKTAMKSSSKASYSRRNAFQRMCQRHDFASPVYQ